MKHCVSLLVSVAAVALVIVQGADSRQGVRVIEAGDELVIRDAKGRKRIVLSARDNDEGLAVIAVYDVTGRQRANISGSDKGSAVALVGSDGKVVAEVGHSETQQRSVVRVISPNRAHSTQLAAANEAAICLLSGGAMQADLAVSDTQGARLMMRPDAGAGVCAVNVTAGKDGSASLVLDNPNSKGVSFLETASDGNCRVGVRMKGAEEAVAGVSLHDGAAPLLVASGAAGGSVTVGYRQEGAGLAIVDDKGQARAAVRFDPKSGEVALMAKDSDGKIRAQLGCSGKVDSGLFLFDGSGIPRVMAGILKGEEPRMVLSTGKGGKSVLLSTGSDGVGSVEAYDVRGVRVYWSGSNK
ncbi:MAG: hypothetical protein IT458_06660 [Planctomycetes bacterium]|nr:hypothetical protein [Planctomycetota bacterium]